MATASLPRMSAAATLFRLTYTLTGMPRDEFVYKADLVDRLEALGITGVSVDVREAE